MSTEWVQMDDGKYVVIPENSTIRRCSAERRENRAHRYSRPLTDGEKDVLTVAAEIVRRRYADDVSDRLDEQMRRWAMRLKDSHDELLRSLRLPDVEES